MSPQIPLALRFPPDQQFAAFHGSEPARLAAQAVASGASIDWLFLAGPQGSGKSHLLMAACACAEQQGMPARFLPLARLIGQLTGLLEGPPPAGLVCLDEVDVVAGHHDDEVALFHFHNSARGAATRLIYASTLMPSALPWTVPDLRSRLQQCTRLALSPLDEPARRSVLRERAARRGLEMDEAVLDYLFRHVGRDLGGLTVVLDQLDHASMAAQRRLTVPFVRQQLFPGADG